MTYINHAPMPRGLTCFLKLISFLNCKMQLSSLGHSLYCVHSNQGDVSSNVGYWEYTVTNTGDYVLFSPCYYGQGCKISGMGKCIPCETSYRDIIHIHISVLFWDYSHFTKGDDNWKTKQTSIAKHKQTSWSNFLRLRIGTLAWTQKLFHSNRGF